MSLSAELFERAKKVTPGGVHSPVRGFSGMGMAPIFFEKADGAYLTSVDGKRYIDFCQSFGPNILGHRDPDVTEVVQQAVSEAWTFGAADPYSLYFAEWLLEKLPFVDKLRFVNSGTEAVMSALRVARAATGRDKVIKFEGCYHGHVDSMLVKAGSGLAGAAASSSAGVGDATAAQTLVVPLNDIQQLQQVMDQHGKDVAAIIIEPLPANYGLLLQEKQFLQQVASMAKLNGSLFIFDEVISGFRVGFGGMAELWGIEPDLVTYGKIIGGGFPVGCFAGKQKFMDMVAPVGPVYQAGTLAANPIAIRAGHATLKKCIDQDVYETLNKRGKRFADQIAGLLEKHRVNLQIVHFGSLFWLHSMSDQIIRSTQQLNPQQGPQFAPLFKALLDKGVYLAPNAYEVGFLSLAHTEAILDQVVDIFDQCLQELAE